jgi:hypothetical protein
MLQWADQGSMRLLAAIGGALATLLAGFRGIRDKYGMKALDDDDHLGSLIAEGRVLLAITPDGPPSAWTSWGLGQVR